MRNSYKPSPVDNPSKEKGKQVKNYYHTYFIMHAKKY
jgi:hypothetical protein